MSLRPSTAFHPRLFSVVGYKAYADLRAESEKYYASYLWWILEPLLQMCTYYVVFGLLFRRGTQDYVPFLLVGLVTWRWFTAIVNEGAASISNSHHLIGQVYLPKFIFPTVCVLTQTFKFVVVFLVLLVFLWIYGFPLTYHYVALPILFAVQLCVVVGVTYCVASLFPFLPDIRLLVDTGLMLLFFVSGIFFSGASIPEEYQTAFYLNPMATLLEGYRNILMYQTWPDFSALFWAGIVGIVGIVVGFSLIRLNDRNYAKLTR